MTFYLGGKEINIYIFIVGFIIWYVSIGNYIYETSALVCKKKGVTGSRAGSMLLWAFVIPPIEILSWIQRLMK